jgi:hypothetical protein
MPFSGGPPGDEKGSGQCSELTPFGSTVHSVNHGRENSRKMFVEYLSLIAGVTVLIFAFMEGRTAGALGTSVGLVLGLSIGLATFWGTRAALKWTCGRLNLYEPNLPPLRLALSWFICIAAFIWMGALGLIVSWLTRQVIHWI